MRFYTACKCAKKWLEMGEMVLKTRFSSIKVVNQRTLALRCVWNEWGLHICVSAFY